MFLGKQKPKVFQEMSLDMKWQDGFCETCRLAESNLHQTFLYSTRISWRAKYFSLITIVQCICLHLPLSNYSANWATIGIFLNQRTLPLGAISLYVGPVYFVWVQLLVCLCWILFVEFYLFGQIQTIRTGGQHSRMVGVLWPNARNFFCFWLVAFERLSPPHPPATAQIQLQVSQKKLRVGKLEGKKAQI